MRKKKKEAHRFRAQKFDDTLMKAATKQVNLDTIVQCVGVSVN